MKVKDELEKSNSKETEPITSESLDMIPIQNLPNGSTFWVREDILKK